MVKKAAKKTTKAAPKKAAPKASKKAVKKAVKKTEKKTRNRKGRCTIYILWNIYVMGSGGINKCYKKFMILIFIINRNFYI